MSPVFDRLAQYFRSKRTPLRIDLMGATFTEAQWAGLVTCAAWLFGVSSPV